MCDSEAWYYMDYEQSKCNSECTIQCNLDTSQSIQYCCPSAYSTKGIIPVGGQSMWWIAVIIVVFVIIAIVLSCWYTMTRRKRMLMMMNSQNRMVMGNSFVQQQIIQPAMPYNQSNQQPMYQQPELLQQHSQYSYETNSKVNNYPSNMPQNAINMPAIM
ncbi:Hypothetical_protein [Hexamita inflata]|uniref:Hypothetical_protein n=1 Tax=Hexamita inflata TaxID=28002 RepID=A0AA86TFF5_9EUKA|nr:Hypothetical protein HINF_LOCUS3855 [Hexamita inflata]